MTYDVQTIVTDEPWVENCYIILNKLSMEMVVIDPGWNAARIIEAIQSKKGVLKAILLTHAHHDHVGAVAELQQHFNVPCFLHELDNKLLRQAHTYALVFAGRTMKPLTAMQLFNDRTMLSIPDWPITAMHTPGHSPGGVSYLIDGYVFTGDTLLFEHVGRTDTPGANSDHIMASIEKILELPDMTHVLSGHGKRWNIGLAKQWWEQVRLSPPAYNQFGKI